MLEWNVWVGDFNSRKIEPYNILNHAGIREDFRKAYEKYGRGKKPDKGMFLEEVRSTLMYYLWSKCEWEIILQHWPSREGEDGKKIDAYEQIRMNWDRFCEYIWDHRSDLNYF